MAARALDADVVWVGFLGGATGAECERELSALNIPVEIVRTRTPTRVNQEIIDADGTITEVLEPGGNIEEEELNRMLGLCASLFNRYRNDAQVVLSGSLPSNVPFTFYASLIEAAHSSNCSVVLDTSGEVLTASLSSSPDLVKPNREEAAMASGIDAFDDASALVAARKFITLGAQSVALSLGSNGLLWLASADAEPFILRPPLITGRSTVGCGDATLAGLVVGRLRYGDTQQSVALGVACGAANCLADSPGMIEASEVNRLLPQITTRKIVATSKS
jgi:1-phosphofructokinase family hexose kinase